MRVLHIQSLNCEVQVSRYHAVYFAAVYRVYDVTQHNVNWMQKSQGALASLPEVMAWRLKAVHRWSSNMLSIHAHTTERSGGTILIYI